MQLNFYQNTKLVNIYTKNYEKENNILSSKVLGYMSIPNTNKIMIIMVYLNKLGPSILFDLIGADLDYNAPKN